MKVKNTVKLSRAKHMLNQSLSTLEEPFNFSLSNTFESLLKSVKELVLK